MTGNQKSRLRHPLTRLLSLLFIAMTVLVLPSVAYAQATTPTVSSIAITSNPGADNTYATGDTITVSLTYSEAVTITGTPHVVVDIGGQPRNFKYSGDGSSAAAQPFSYTVLVGDRDLDGVSLQVNSLTLNGGTIQATDDSTNATLTHSAMTFANHKVDTQVTLLSNLGQADAANAITVSATESAEATIRVIAGKSFDINAITLDVTTPSDTLDVTVKLVDINSPLYLDYTYTGSVTTAGLQTFTLSEPSEMKFGNVGLAPGRLGGGPGTFTGYQMEIHGSGAGSVALAGTTSETNDSGSVSGISFPGTMNVLKPQMRLSGHEGMIPNLIYADVVSSPPNGSAYAAGDRIDLLFVFSQNVDIEDGHVVPIWLGTGAQHRREARLDTGIYIDYTYLIFSYTVQAGDTDTDGIYIGADPLGDNAGFDLHASYSSAIPADVRLAANQLPASQSVDGSVSRTCEEVLCSAVRSGVSAEDRFPGFSTFIRESNFPFLTLGTSSAWSIEYGGEVDAVVEVVLDRRVDLLQIQFLYGLPSSLYNRLALSVDGTEFLLSAANDTGDFGEYFGWLSPGLTWAEGDVIDVKLIETATATFDAASYIKAEGDTFDVTVTLSDTLANTLTLPIVVAGNGGADATDYSGIPENLVFAPGDTEKTFAVTIEDDDFNDDDESLTLSFGEESHIRSGGANETATITITDTDDPQVTVSFGAALYEVVEGETVTVTVNLSADPERTVDIPIRASNLGGATSPGDYSGVPENLTFNSGDTEMTFTVTATEDDEHELDDEGAQLTFGMLPEGVTAGTRTETVVAIRDDDDPRVMVSFEQDLYTVAEGGTVMVAVTLSADPKRTVVIPITEAFVEGARPEDFSGVPSSMTFNAGDIAASFTFTATQDDVDDDGESALLEFGELPARVTAGTTTETTVSITDDDDPQVTVQFGADAYTVAEGGTQEVTVTLSADPERTVVIPLTTMNQGGAATTDYSVPTSVTFDTGDTEQTITFTATQDDVDDDGESVLLAFGMLPPRVTAGTTTEATVSITDDDDPRVEVSFGSGTYIVPEGGTQQVTVTLSADPERQVVILITATPQGGAAEDDYSGVPDDVTFNSGQKSKSFTFSATDDTQDEDGEKVLLTFGTLPTRVTAGATGQTTISISDDCADVDIWCATMAFGATVHWEGRYDLHATDVDNREFSHNGADYQLWSTEMHQSGHNSGDDNHVVPPFGIPERTEFLIDFLNLSGTSDQVFDPPNNDWLDWTLHVSTVSDGETLTATLRFSEARKLAGAWWRWSGGDIDGLRRAWKTDQLYKLRLVEDPRSGRTPQPLNPPLYLRVQGEVNMTQTWLRWLTPQTRHDRVPSVDSYRIQWKQSSGSWDTSTDVSETTRGPSSQRPVSHYLDGLTPGVEYNIRVIATDSAGDSEPSNEVTYTKPAEAQLSLSNTPAEGEPRIDGIPEVGQTLSADTTGISDVDGLDDVVFQYQWLGGDADIAGAGGATHTVVSGDVGSAIRVRVSFTDDGGNEETLTSAPTVVTAAGLQLRSATVDRGMLTLTYSKELDTGVSLGTAPFTVNVNGSSRSLSGVAVGQSSVLLLLSQAVEAGDMVTVGYTVPDGQDFIRDTLGRKAASFSGQAVTNSTAEDQEDTARGTEDETKGPEHASAVVEPPLTATIHDAPASHDGSAAFTFELELSEELAPDFSYRTLRDDGFTVTGGRVTYVRRLNPPSNIGWEVHVTPDGNGDVNLSFRSTNDCSAQGAICTGEGRKLSERLQLAVAGPNTPATGAPTISGTLQVGETLTAGTTDISDGDGLGSATFAYQWLADDSNISDATNSTYTLVAADAGKAIRVRVSFTDDGEIGEELTSAATGAVAAAPPPLNTPATGLPTITGTARVGETLTASTTDISDADGMTRATFSYQWLADDSNISGATDSSYTLVAADAGKAIRVRVSFTDDGENGEELTSDGTGAVAAAVVRPPLTASARNVPSSHDGSAKFLFELSFSEEFPLSYVTLRDHAFTVSGGRVTYVRRLNPPSNIGWEIHVTPDSDGSLISALPVTGSCEANGAICTGDGRRLSNRLEFTVNGP